MIAANVPHFFQVHLNACKARNFDFTDQNRQPFPQKFTNDLKKEQAALDCALKALPSDMDCLLKKADALGHALFLELPVFVQVGLLAQMTPLRRASWLKEPRKSGTNAYLKMTLEQIAALTRGLSKSDCMDILNMTDVLGHNPLHHIAIKRRNRLYYNGKASENRLQVYEAFLDASTALLNGLEPFEQFSFLGARNQEGFTPLHGLSGEELNRLIGSLPSDVRKELMEIKTHIYDLDKGWVHAGVLEPVFHENPEQGTLITAKDIMDLTADFTPAQNASFFTTKTINGIDLMFCLPPHEQAEKLCTMSLDQKRPFLFPYVLMQMEGDDIVQSVLNLPFDKKISLLFHPSESSVLYPESECVFDCLSASQKAQVLLGLTPRQWQEFQKGEIPKPLEEIAEPMRLLRLIEKTISAENSWEALDCLKQALPLFWSFTPKGNDRFAVYVNSVNNTDAVTQRGTMSHDEVSNGTNKKPNQGGIVPPYAVFARRKGR